ncbi:MAG: hypothetical protein PWP71_1716 [Clostridia bacterium]|jgi:hypothetical protein|nr:hypothetical protein [Clostridia bacterium]
MRFHIKTAFISCLKREAHTIDTDLYDVNYHKMQDALIYNAYTAVRTTRLIFANHSRVKGYTVIPDWLYKGKIRIY